MSETQGFEALQGLSSNPQAAPAEPKIELPKLGTDIAATPP